MIASQKFAQQLYEQAAASDAGGYNQTEAVGRCADDDVVDAEIVEDETVTDVHGAEPPDVDDRRLARLPSRRIRRGGCRRGRRSPTSMP